MERWFDKLPDSHPLKVQFQEQLKVLYDEENDQCFVHAKPHVELLSVSICPNDGKPSRVYGMIQVVDGEGATFNLYERDEKNAEIVLKDGLLPLTFRKDRVISPSYEVKVKVDINDKTRETKIAGTLCWDYSVKDDYDEVKTEHIDGHCGRVVVRYITYRYAVSATMDMTLFREGSDDADYADVYGEIVAHCGKSGSIVLFERTRDQSMRVKYDTCMKLSRHVVAVSVHSSLVITANLWNKDTNKRICCEDLTLEPFHDGRVYETLNGMIEVMVQWRHVYDQSSPERKLKHEVEEACNEEKLDSKKPQPDSNQHPSRFIVVNSGNIEHVSESMKRLSTKLEGGQILEVFSVLIGSYNGEGFNLWGTIKVGHRRGESFIFQREKTEAEKLLSNQIVPIMAPNYKFAGSVISIKLKFKDAAADDCIISAGQLKIDDNHLDGSRWYNRPLCSVVRGNTGYAAVHYAIFSSGIQATVKVCLDSGSISKRWTNDCFQVHGSVYAGYSNFNYVTPYEKKHYRNELFQRHPENPEPLSSLEVPLSKYVVGVPVNSKLFVDLNLMVKAVPQTQASDNLLQAGETFQGRLSFNTPDDCREKVIRRNPSGGYRVISLGNVEQTIQGSRQNDIIVSVLWSEVPHAIDEGCSNLPELLVKELTDDDFELFG